ncbi:hypothetical protein [Phormidium tenue]|uniref:hypothetical protein n=1 Tax=Phormidium tenue TaxID=126344 RepID=UPI0011153A13|nr:hypothetical protein [Phormidium tenue]MBD2232506.1 hypothetical protein [Phormidium tenue FACHB-1052]
MSEENQLSQDAGTVRDLVVPSSQQSGEENGDRSPIKTEHDILAQPEKDGQQPSSQPPYADRDLVVPISEENAASEDDDRSPTKTERGLQD